MEADTVRQDAVVMVEQTGVAVDLPNLMTAKVLMLELLNTMKIMMTSTEN